MLRDVVLLGALFTALPQVLIIAGIERLRARTVGDRAIHAEIGIFVIVPKPNMWVISVAGDHRCNSTGFGCGSMLFEIQRLCG